MPDPSDLSAITDLVRTYATAMTSGDRAALERIFHDRASEVGHYEGDLLWNTRDAFIAMCEAAGDPSAEASWDIRTVSMHGDIATVHLEDIWAGDHFDTILTLLKHDGAWRVVSKVFRVQAR